VGRSVAKIKMMPNLSLQRTSWKCAAEFKVERPLSGIGYGRLGSEGVSRTCRLSAYSVEKLVFELSFSIGA